MSLITHEIPDLQHRGVHVVMNMVASEKEVAEKIVESRMLEILMALSILQDPERKQTKDAALQTLEYGVEHGLIKPNKATHKA